MSGDNGADPVQKSLLEESFKAGYEKYRKDDAKAREAVARHMRSCVDAAYEDGRTVEKTVSTQYTTHTQPYQIETDVGVKYSAKGECQPEASVKITRLLDDGSHIVDLIHADMSRGVEEMMAAIAEIQKRNVKP